MFVSISDFLKTKWEIKFRTIQNSESISKFENAKNETDTIRIF